MIDGGGPSVFLTHGGNAKGTRARDDVTHKLSGMKRDAISETENKVITDF